MKRSLCDSQLCFCYSDYSQKDLFISHCFKQSQYQIDMFIKRMIESESRFCCLYQQSVSFTKTILLTLTLDTGYNQG